MSIIKIIMIVLLTDYGYQGPYVGQLTARILEYSPSATIIDLMHDLPAFNITAAASLIPAVTSDFPAETIFICVVDPGVGSNRKPLLLKSQGRYYIGPDNGIFDNVKCDSDDHHQSAVWEILWRPEKLSTSFHGRDLFAVIAAQLFNGTLNFNNSLCHYQPTLKAPSNTEDQIIYFDNFGNAITSIIKSSISENNKLRYNNTIISYAETFSKRNIGDAFWYYNSMNLVEIACNQVSAQNKLTLSIGQIIEIV